MRRIKLMVALATAMALMAVSMSPASAQRERGLEEAAEHFPTAHFPEERFPEGIGGTFCFQEDEPGPPVCIELDDDFDDDLDDDF
jgi:hypothetical protein